MQTSEFGKSKGLLKTLTEGNWSDAFDGLSISLLLTSNPAIQVGQAAVCIIWNSVYVCVLSVKLYLEFLI